MPSGRHTTFRQAASGAPEPLSVGGYVAPDKLPADFAKIPENHPKGRVLTSVAGTPQAREAAIANRIPQTATVGRKDAHFDPTYDGPPRFEPIAGTSLAAAANTPSAVIEVDPTSYYGCEMPQPYFVPFSPSSPRRYQGAASRDRRRTAGRDR